MIYGLTDQFWDEPFAISYATFVLKKWNISFFIRCSIPSIVISTKAHTQSKYVCLDSTIAEQKRISDL